MPENVRSGLFRGDLDCCTNCVLSNTATVNYSYINQDAKTTTYSTNTNNLSLCVINPDIDSVKVVCSEFNSPGDVLTYNIVATNNGDVPLSYITTKETLPAGVQYVTINPSGTFFTDGDGFRAPITVLNNSTTVSINLSASSVTISPGDSVVFSYYVKTDNPFNYSNNPISGPSLVLGKDLYNYTVSAYSNNFECYISNALLTVLKSSNPATLVSCADNVIYTITVVNYGNLTAKNVILNDVFDSEFSFDLSNITATSGSHVLPVSTSFNTTLGILEIKNFSVLPGTLNMVSIQIPGTIVCCSHK